MLQLVHAGSGRNLPINGESETPPPGFLANTGAVDRDPFVGCFIGCVSCGFKHQHNPPDDRTISGDFCYLDDFAIDPCRLIISICYNWIDLSDRTYFALCASLFSAGAAIRADFWGKDWSFDGPPGAPVHPGWGKRRRLACNLETAQAIIYAEGIDLMGNWRTRTLLVGAVVGTVAGLIAAYILVQRANEVEQAPKINAGDGVKVGLGVLGVLKLISDIGTRR